MVILAIGLVVGFTAGRLGGEPAARAVDQAQLSAAQLVPEQLVPEQVTTQLPQADQDLLTEMNRRIQSMIDGKNHQLDIGAEISQITQEKRVLAGDLWGSTEVHGCSVESIHAYLESIDVELQRAYAYAYATGIPHLPLTSGAASLRDRTLKYAKAAKDTLEAYLELCYQAPKAETAFGSWGYTQTHNYVCVYLTGPAGQMGTATITDAPHALGSPAAMDFTLDANGQAVVSWIADVPGPYAYSVQRKDANGTLGQGVPGSVVEGQGGASGQGPKPTNWTGTPPNCPPS
jgi:hypothetical protein